VASKFVDAAPKLSESAQVPEARTTAIVESVSTYAGQLKNFRSEWAKITDDKFVLDTITGYKIPFVMEPTQSHEPFQKTFSETENYNIDLCISRLVQIGAVKEVEYNSKQFVSKIFAVPKSDGSFRLILNLKYLNEFVEVQHFKMEDTRTVCNLIEQDMFLASIDLQDAYHLIPICETHQLFLRFKWNGKYFQYTCLPFGLTSAPRVFTKVMRPVISFLRKRGNISVQYLDDLLLLSKTLEGCKSNIQNTIDCFTKLGLIINYKKSDLNPSKSIQYLGLIFNSQEMTISLPQKKCDKILSLCFGILKNELFPIQILAELIGNLIAAMAALAYSKLYTRQLEYEKSLHLEIHYNDYNAYMSLSEEAKKDVHWWIAHLPNAVNKLRRDKFDFCIETDASLSGWGARFGRKRASGFWTEREINELEHIDKLELTAAEYALHTFFKDQQNKQILLRMDNTNSIAYINKLGGCRSPILHSISKRIWQWCEENNIWLVATYITSSQNYVADFESRRHKTENDSEWCLNDKYFNTIIQRLGKPDIDLFASYLNYKCQRYISWHPDPKSSFVDAFTIPWSKTFFYLFPPFCLMSRVLRKIRQECARGIVVAPLWGSQPWYPLYLSMAESDVITLGPFNDLLFCPLTNRPHPMCTSLRLMVAVLSNSR